MNISREHLELLSENFRNIDETTKEIINLDNIILIITILIRKIAPNRCYFFDLNQYNIWTITINGETAFINKAYFNIKSNAINAVI